MELKAQFESALREYMRSGNETGKRTIRMVIAAIKQFEIDKGIKLEDAGIIPLLHKEIKTRREAIAEAKKAGRNDLILANEQEIAILEPFLPKGYTQEELTALVQQCITEAGASSPADMGKVMKILLPRIAGKAPNDVVSQLVRQTLQNLQ